jgi:hypothetical protein
MSALGHERDIKVHEQTNWQSRQLQIRDDLRFVDRRKLLDNLQFNNDDVVDNQIRAKIRLEVVAFVDEWNSKIGGDSVSAGLEFNFRL